MPYQVDQYMVSKCLIRFWCRTDRDRVEYFDLRDGPRFKTEHPTKIMYRTSDGTGGRFVPVEFAGALEARWSLVEKRGCEAIRGVLNGLFANEVGVEAAGVRGW